MDQATLQLLRMSRSGCLQQQLHEGREGTELRKDLSGSAGHTCTMLESKNVIRQVILTIYIVLSKGLSTFSWEYVPGFHSPFSH